MVQTARGEDELNRQLLEQPKNYEYRYTHASDCELREILFRSLAGRRDDYLRLLFPSGIPTDRSQAWSLRDAQGAVDGAEYTAGAKGTACGHIFKSGESTYHCKTCAADETCVLCARCFEASDHEGHMVFISVSPGNSGCCDCGDAEAWRKVVPCTIHSADAPSQESQQIGNTGKGKMPAHGSDLPVDLVESIRMTIARAVDYLCDVFSCSPEQLRLPKTVETIERDERMSRLGGVYGTEPLEEKTEYALVLWNDEKHTVFDVETQVARACKKTKRFGYNKAMEVNDIGRSIIDYSTDVPELLRKAKVIEQLKVTVTIRSARDTFREQMCETIIDWISDIAGCAVGNDAHILRNIVCEELLNPWRAGSSASNRDIGKAGIDDHEIEENDKLRRQYRSYIRPLTTFNGTQVTINVDMGEDGDDNDDNDEDEDDEDFFLHGGTGDDDDDMDIEFDDIRQAANIAASAPEGDMDIDFLDENEDMTEALEATIAGYPPPPPPPQPGQRRRILTPADSDDGDGEQAQPNAEAPYNTLPRTPKVRGKQNRPMRPSRHWLEKPEGYKRARPSEPCEDIWQRVRLDFLILYDLRLWKVLRIHLRHLYITTVVTIPHFKRILGMRFAGLYTPLAQLYLIADREPDHSIINLSVQMLTTPTITEEVVERANFLTNLMAILYTFLTTRQVGYPTDVSPRATLAFDAGAVTNRRMFHFFLDLRWLFQSEFIHERLRAEPRYLMQFIDLIKLQQGVCPNVRATGEHVEYESDAWIHASIIVKEANKLCKQVAVAFELKNGSEERKSHLQRALRMVAQATMINSFGYERKRFTANELKEDLGWHRVGPFDDSGKTYSVANHIVQTEPMSFHHPMHYLLSWLIEDGKSMSRDEMRSLLHFSPDDLRDPWNATRQSPGPKQLTPDELLCSLFEHPLRVCVWLAQMKASMWVRNGITLRHQAHTYRSVSHRDVGYQRDILMIQAGLVLCGAPDELPGERFLAQMIDRFQMTKWFSGDFSVVEGFEEPQQLEVIEDFLHLLVVALRERGNLMPTADGKKQHDKMLQHDIAHALCFKPLSFSDLAGRVTEKVSESDDFNRVLESMTIYRAPEGLNDTGTFELKPEFIELVDPYYAHYSRNHREEAENIYKKHMAGKVGKKAEDVVFEPTLGQIESGLFADLAAFTATPLFARMVATSLEYSAGVRHVPTKIQVTRIETFLHMVLHLVMIAVLEDERGTDGFVKNASVPHGSPDAQAHPSVVSAMVALSGMDEYSSCHPTIKHILRKMQLRQPDKVNTVMGQLGATLDRSETASPASLSAEDKERKKQEALARQARVMAKMKEQQNSFLQNQGLEAFGDEFNEYDDMSVTEEPEAIDQRKTWSFPTGTCIWCQEEADDSRLYGTFAYLGESSVLRSTPTNDSDFVQEVIDTPENLDRSADDIRPFGVAGKNKQSVKKVGTDGKVTETERQGLSKGFPHQKDGIRAPVATSCGHIMHYSCFELYMTNSYQRQRLQIARNHPEAMDLKEFCCPLCKALGNTFLPIIWKAKECARENELHAAPSFSDYMAQLDSQPAADLSFLDDTAPQSFHSQVQGHGSFNDRAMAHITTTFSPPIVADMSGLSPDNTGGGTPTPTDSGRRYQLRSGINLSRLFGASRPGHHSSQSSFDSNASGLSPTPGRVRSSELFAAYARMDDTLFANGFCGAGVPQSDPGANPIEPLSRALGMSVAAFEIAHRGVDGGRGMGTSLVGEVGEQTLTALRVLSETIESYLAVHVVRGAWQNRVAALTARRREVMRGLLFGVGANRVEAVEAIGGRTLLGDDVFLFLADWLALMAPGVAEASSVVQVCLWAEVVKVIVVGREIVARMGGELKTERVEARVSAEFRAVVAEIGGMDAGALSERQLSVLRHMVDRYALTFLRKSIVLLLVRYGLDFECPYNLDPSSPELHRLTALLHLPSLEELFSTFAASTQAGTNLRHITTHWTARPNTPITLPHPAIFELLGLPRTYDTLTELTTRHRCPSTGKDLTDPCICLLCGAIFCSQAVCCMRARPTSDTGITSTSSGRGGAHQHLDAHNLSAGIFINVRKCMVLFLHGRGNGTFVPAPYLDRWGETDPTLRRHQQLFLSWNRLERGLREVWLQHGVQSVISRRLEGDVNPGGWETL